MIAANAVLFSSSKIDLSAYGIDRVSPSQAEDYLTKSSPSVLGLHCDSKNYKDLIRLAELEKHKNPRKRVILFHDSISADELLDICNNTHPCDVHAFNTELDFAKIFEHSFDRYYELEQAQTLIALVNEKNEELKKLTFQLEQRVEERQYQLEQTRKKNLGAEKRLTVLKQTLVQIYQATSLSEIEHGITEALKEEFQIDWVKIRRPSQSNLGQKSDKVKSYKVVLKSGQKDFGHLYFFKKPGQSFDKSEKRFLSQVAEAVSLSIERTFQYQKGQELKRQWEATFDAISDPICLTDQDYNILRVNAGFLIKTNTQEQDEHINKKCYESLFDRTSPCSNCQRGQIFQIRNPSKMKQSEVFDVYSSNIGQSDRVIYFQMYRDITQDLNLQRQVIESAKMAELGTISSSIAHELNNPIGGMLNFVQLMKMDLDGSEDFYPDLIEIEKGIVKCKNIVKNLLGFSRKSFHADIQEVSLNEVIEQAIMITELKTRSIGIKINYNKPEQSYLINGRFNLLTHAIRNVLQNSQESLIEKRKQDKKFEGTIDVRLFEEGPFYCIQITDNGDGILEENKHKIFDPLYTTKDPETNSGLGLTLALQIVEEHKGSIKVSTDKDKNLSLKMLFSKSEV